jgi:hypothetical protein
MLGLVSPRPLSLVKGKRRRQQAVESPTHDVSSRLVFGKMWTTAGFDDLSTYSNQLGECFVCPCWGHAVGVADFAMQRKWILYGATFAMQSCSRITREQAYCKAHPAPP